MLNKPCKIIENCRIFGNGHNIPLIYGFELTDKEKKDFDYLENVEEDFTGFRYRGNVYSLDEFMRTDKNSPFYGTFHGVSNDSFFSGVGILLGDTGESVKAYTFIP